MSAPARTADTFWMSASGVDKSKLEDVGTEVLLVTDYLPDRKAMQLSVPPNVTPSGCRSTRSSTG